MNLLRMAAVIVSWTWVFVASPVEAGLLGFLGFPPWSYKAEPINGRVVDQATGQPIEGAVIVAQWVLQRPPEGHTTDLWVVFEAVTDAEGRYHIPGWGPKTRPWFRWLEDADPRLLVLKPGYWPETLWNGAKGSSGGINDHGDKVRKSYWNGKDIVLWPFPIGAPISEEWKAAHRLNPYPDSKVLTEAEWADQLSRIQGASYWSRLDDEDDGPLDRGRRINRFILMIQDECARLPAKYRLESFRVPQQYQALLLGERRPCP